jgi:Tfp pilus assembly protein PilN
MALSARRRDADHIDLLRSLRPPPSIAQVFPRQLATGMILAAAAVGLILWNTLAEIQDGHQRLMAQSASYKWAAALQTDAIKTERKGLSDEVSSIQQFVGTRAIWTNYLRDLPTRLPSNACLQSLTGTYEMKHAGKTAGRQTGRSLVISGMARFTDKGSAPKEIDAFLDSLRSADLLRKTFPNVNLAEIKWKKEPGADIALFTIIASPVEKAESGGEEKAAAGKEKAKPAEHG